MWKGFPWPRVLVAGGLILALGFLWAWTGVPREPVVLTPWLMAEAWPRRGEPYVLVFADPLCPFCQRLEAGLAGDDALKPYVRFAPVLGHEGSYEAWLLRLVHEGWSEDEARVWLERGAEEARASGVRLTPTTVVVDGGVSKKTLVGFTAYARWRKEVMDALAGR